MDATMTNSIRTLPLILILGFAFPSATTCFSNETDLLSLLAFKSAIDLDPHGSLNSWNETTHFCSWKGIQCGQKHRDRVVSINLRSQGLVGSLSPHVGNLSFLRTIILQNNTFHGPIPQEIGRLRRLEVVYLSNNSFTGEIPKNLSGCPNLVYLNLIANNLSGPIPSELGSLSKLKALGLARNDLFGLIPPFVGNITSLTQLALGTCGLKGEIPESLAQLQKLYFLQLGENSLTGTIPSGLFNMSQVQYFAVPFNKLHGVIPTTIGLTLPSLTRLDMSANQFSGPMPVSISNASLLELIAFTGNYLTGPTPRVDRLTHLQYFVSGSNLVADDISFISSFTNCSRLLFLEVEGNLLSGSLPDTIGNLSSHLDTLYLGSNQIHGKVPSSVGNLISLTEFSLSDNFLEGPIPSGITQLSNVLDLEIHTNRFTNEVPSSIGNLSFLTRLYLNENNLSGNVPPSLGNCTYLIELDLSRNNFNGLIPSGIMSLSSITVIFNLSYNAFEGPIPYEVGSLVNLLALDLSNNRLSGPIPNSLVNCISLQQLYLEGNFLEGKIPTAMSALMGLQDLDLSRNNLSGPIPSFLEKLNLEKLNLSFNRLQGEVPTVGVFKNKTAISLDGNRQLCGGISDLKLPPCSPAKSQKKNLSTLKKILIPIVVTGGTCLMLFALFTYKQRMSRKNATPSMSSFIGVQFMRLSYADLLKATGGFSNANLLGFGRFGSVYKGILDDGQTVVAVKVLNLFVRGASKSFAAECNALRNVRHRNLLKILSVCESIDFQGNDFKALVYEFKANGSLEKWLYQSREQSAETNGLNMIQRLNIAIDIAQALNYLHFGTESFVVHGDLKPSNILLDHDMTAYVGDFGLAKIVSNVVPSHESSNSIGIRGTIGYVAPEYATNNLVPIQGDLYSYGILLLEMFTNKRPTDEAFKDHVNLHSFVSNALTDHVMEIVDPAMLRGLDTNSNVIKDCMASTLSIGLACSRTVAKDRMSITEVERELRKIRAHLLAQE